MKGDCIGPEDVKAGHKPDVSEKETGPLSVRSWAFKNPDIAVD